MKGISWNNLKSEGKRYKTDHCSSPSPKKTLIAVRTQRNPLFPLARLNRLRIVSMLRHKSNYLLYEKNSDITRVSITRFLLKNCISTWIEGRLTGPGKHLEFPAGGNVWINLLLWSDINTQHLFSQCLMEDSCYVKKGAGRFRRPPEAEG